MKLSILRQSTCAIVVLATLSVLGGASCDHQTTVGGYTTRSALRNDMRRLWTEHALWTRVFLIDSIAGLPDTDAATQRLLRNQVDIGNAIKPYYGTAAGDQLATLLRDHILGAAAVVTAAKAGDAAALATANTAWYANAHQIAVFLADANPHLALADLDAMMITHLDQTEAEATARLHSDWATDVQTYDLIVAHLVEMADAISAAITLQFPEMVAADTTVTPSSSDLHRAMRGLWEDHVSWTRVFLVSAIAGLPDTSAAQARLLQNQVDIGNAIKPFYGEDAGNMLTSLLHDHIALAARVVVDAKTGDMADLRIASNLWYANADEIAAFLAAANSNWPLDHLRSMMRTHLDQTLAEATARLTADWATDVSSYDAVEDHILHMSDVLGDGIVAQFPDRFAH